jgi:hypothetical protein
MIWYNLVKGAMLADYNFGPINPFNVHIINGKVV